MSKEGKYDEKNKKPAVVENMIDKIRYSQLEAMVGDVTEVV